MTAIHFMCDPPLKVLVGRPRKGLPIAIFITGGAEID